MKIKLTGTVPASSVLLMREIILASRSPRRKELLKKLGLSFRVVPSNYEEDMDLDLKPHTLARYLSKQKALAVAKTRNGPIVIAADTLIFFQGKLLGKPHTKHAAKAMLQKIQGKKHSVISGFTIIDTERDKTRSILTRSDLVKIVSESVETVVYMKKLSKSEIDNYVDSLEPLDKAGAYAIQERGSLLVEKIEGDYYNVVGLPLNALARGLKKFGVRVL